ncbi:hypothetical protein [Lysobacter olei]
MRTKNSKAHTKAEAAHLAAVKSVACVTCDAPAPSEAHHVVQGDHWTCIALCQPCHTGKGGIHGDQTMLRLRYRIGGTAGELAAINETLGRVYG